MSIQPPSDILLDVALAADPATRAAATRRLSASAGSDSAASFATALDATRVPDRLTVATASVSHSAKTAADTLPKAMTALEAFFLRTAFESMLPKETHVGGFAGAGAGVWKSMMAETLANTVAASGGLKLIRPSGATT